MTNRPEYELPPLPPPEDEVLIKCDDGTDWLCPAALPYFTETHMHTYGKQCANAIMAGYDTAQQRAALSQRPAGAEPVALELIVDEQQERAAFEAAAKGRMSLVRTWDDEGYDSPFTRGAYVGWKLARAAQVQRPPVAPDGYDGLIAAKDQEIAELRRQLEAARANERRYRGTLQELRIRLHAAGRRPEECHEMSLIDAAIELV